MLELSDRTPGIEAAVEVILKEGFLAHLNSSLQDTWKPKDLFKALPLESYGLSYTSPTGDTVISSSFTEIEDECSAAVHICVNGRSLCISLIGRRKVAIHQTVVNCNFKLRWETDELEPDEEQLISDKLLEAVQGRPLTMDLAKTGNIISTGGTGFIVKELITDEADTPGTVSTTLLWTPEHGLIVAEPPYYFGYPWEVQKVSEMFTFIEYDVQHLEGHKVYEWSEKESRWELLP